MSNDPIGTILGDLQYLVDELEALKYLIDVVPVYERPGGELSVCEHIRLIHFVQDKLAENLNEEFSASRLSLNEFISEYKAERSDIHVEQKKGVQHYINKLIHARVGLLNSLSEINDSLSDFAVQNLKHLIGLERAIFKEMAGKVLAINKEA